MILNQKIKVTADLENQIDNLNAENKVIREDSAEELKKERKMHDEEIELAIENNEKAQTKFEERMKK